eukprot:9470302-Pyramimonas_sp.AAC.1
MSKTSESTWPVGDILLHRLFVGVLVELAGLASDAPLEQNTHKPWRERGGEDGGGEPRQNGR